MPNEIFLYNRRGAEYAEKIFFCRKTRNNTQNLKNKITLFFALFAFFAAKDVLKVVSASSRLCG
jgi:hypothetical protein